jgi:hypothetical protein
VPKRDIRAREALASLRIGAPEDVALWARKRGLLGVYIEFIPARNVLPACWQVVRPGHRTGDGPPWQRGHKTFIVHSLPEKHAMEERARRWAGTEFGCPSWVRIEGLGNALFPEAVAEELGAYLPDLVTYRQRQHKLTSRN